MRAYLIIIFQVRQQYVAEAPLSEHNKVVKAFPSDRTDQPFGISILPRGAWRRWSVANDVQMLKASTPTEESVVKASAKARPRSATRGPPRLDPTQREAIITREAVAFFAECGFEGQTRELAKRLRITQPLLYRYFPTKEALIERVYQEVFVGRWNASWGKLITDRAEPLKSRLTQFYREYAETILTYEWIRLFMFAGLKDLGLNDRYLKMLRERVFEKVIVEIRAAYGRPPIAQLPI